MVPRRFWNPTLAWAAGFVLAPAVADAQPVTEPMTPQALGVGEALRAGAARAASTTLNPAGAGLVPWNVTIEASYGFGGKEDSSVAAVAMCDSATTRVAACVYYHRLSSAPEGGERTLHEAGLTLAVPFGQRLILGTTTKWLDYSESGSATVPSDNSRSGDVLVDGGLILKLGSSTNVGLVGYNLVGHDQGSFPRAIGTGLGLRLGGRLMVEADGVWNLVAASEDRPSGRYGIGAEYFFAASGGQMGYPLRAGYVRDVAGSASYVTAGIGYSASRLGIDAGMRKQLTGIGNELMIQIGIVLTLEHRPPQTDYGRSFAR